MSVKRRATRRLGYRNRVMGQYSGKSHKDGAEWNRLSIALFSAEVKHLMGFNGAVAGFLITVLINFMNPVAYILLVRGNINYK